MKSNDIDDILSNIDDDGEGIEILKDLQKDKTILSPSPIERLREKLDKKDDKLSFLNDIDSNEFNENIVLKKADIEELPEIEIDKEDEEGNQGIKNGRTLKRKKTGKKIEPVEFKLKGTRTWNTREPYTAQIDTEALEADYNDLDQSFYFIKSNEKETVIIGEMKRAMFKFVRGSVDSIFMEYSEFLDKKISDITRELGKDFGFNGNDFPSFIYHIGIITLYAIIINQLRESKIGFCFKLSQDSNVVRYIPPEFIKETAMNWHNDHIYVAEFPHDGIIEFNELKRKISSQYMKEVEKNDDKINGIIEKTNANSISRIEREKLFRNKWAELFGRNKILVYNRFLERTIFKGNR